MSHFKSEHESLQEKGVNHTITFFLSKGRNDIKLLLYLNYECSNKTLTHEGEHNTTRQATTKSVHTYTWSHTHTHTHSGHTARLSAPAHHWRFHQMFHLFFSLALFSLSQHQQEMTDGWKRRESRRRRVVVGGGGVEGCFSSIFFFSLSFFNLN